MDNNEEKNGDLADSMMQYFEKKNIEMTTDNVEKFLDEIFKKNICNALNKDFLDKLSLEYDMEKKNDHNKDFDDPMQKMRYLTNLLNTKIIIDNIVEIRKSHIHGYGVFASQNIKKDDIITVYPAHCIANMAERNALFMNEQFIVDPAYKLDVSDRIEIYGNPNIKYNSLLLGHMINDSASFTYEDIINVNIEITKKNIKNKIATYLLTSNNNSILIYNKDKTLAYIVATKDININDEILMSYTPQYWLNDKEIVKLFLKMAYDDDNFQLFLKKYLWDLW